MRGSGCGDGNCCLLPAGTYGSNTELEHSVAGGRCQGQDRLDRLLVWIRLLLGMLDPRLKTPVCPADLSVIGVE
jgi:hypothetical protein